MKQILSRLFNHEVLSREEAETLMKNITQNKYNEAQIASLLTVFQMRGAPGTLWEKVWTPRHIFLE